MSQQSNPATLREALRALRSTAKDARYDWSEIMAIKIERIADEIEKVAASGTESAHPPEYYDDVLKGAPDPGGESYYRQPSQAAASPEGEGREALAREIADEFCGGSEAVFEIILAKLAASHSPFVDGPFALRQSAAPSGGGAPTRAEAEVWLEQNGYPYLEQLFNEFVDGPITRSRMNSLLAPLFAQFVLAKESKTGAVKGAGERPVTPNSASRIGSTERGPGIPESGETGTVTDACPTCGHRSHAGVSCFESDCCGCGQ